MGIKATIKGEHGIIAEVMIPSSFRDVSLSQYISFSKEAALIREDGHNYIVQMAKAVGEFTGVDLHELLSANIGDMYGDTEGLDGSLRALYSYILKIVSEYKPQLMTPETAGFEYKGELFQIPVILQNTLGGLPVLPNISVLEAIECFEVQRISTANIDETGDENGSILFTYYLRMLAILCRKPGEMIPVSESERERFFNERSKYFKEIPAGVAMDVDFFLSNTLLQLGKTHHAIGSLLLQNFVHGVEIKRQKLTHGKKRLRTMNQRSKR